MNSRPRVLVVLLLIGVGLESPTCATAADVVKNGGFEDGNPGELPAHWRMQKEGGEGAVVEGTVVCTDQEAYAGAKSLFIEQTSERGYTHCNYSAQLAAGSYALKFCAKSALKEGLLAQVYDTRTWHNFVNKRFQTEEGQWTEFRYEFAITEDMPISIQIGVHDTRGSLWLDEVSIEQIAVPETVIWDTVKALDPEGTTAEEIEGRDGWALVPPDTGADHAFKGDAVAQNERLTAVLCLASPGIAVYSRPRDLPRIQRRMTLVPTDPGGEAAVALGSVQVSENTGDAMTLAVSARTEAGETMRLAVSLRRGQAFIEVKPLENAGGLRIRARARFAVIPDFFGDDVVLDAREFTADRLYVPSENLLVSLLEGGDSMLVTVWPIGEQNAELLLGGKQDDRIIEATEISFDDKSIYVATVDAPGVWDHEDVSEASALGKDLALEWERPFDAKWRADFSAPKRHESWNFRRGREDTWFSARGRMVYPCWFAGEKAYLRLAGADYLGLAVIYPLERTNDTPLSVFTPVDIVRETLGVGPCEYVLDREGLSNRPYGGERQLMRGAVCATTDSIEPFFWAGLEKRESVVVSDMADDVLAFITTVNERIQEYRTFASKVTEICEAARRDNPALKPVADRIQEIAQDIEQQYQERLEVFKTPSDTAKLTEELKELTRRESPESLGRCVELGAALRHIAGSQDGLMGRNRVTVKRLRREAAVLSATEPAAADLAEEIRELAQQTLRRKHGMEGE